MSENHPVNNFPIMFDIARKYNNLRKLVAPKSFGYLGISIFHRWYKMLSFLNSKCMKHKVVSSNMSPLVTCLQTIPMWILFR